MDQVKNIIYPELTICFRNPFVNEKLLEWSINNKTYLGYLKGDIALDETNNNIDYSQVTFDLYDSLQSL